MSLVVFGSANADFVFSLPQLPAPGETVLGEAGAAIPGGKGLNQAIAAARAGAATRFCGAVGADAHGAMLRAVLAEAGVDISGLEEVSAPTAMAAVMVDGQGRNQIAVSSGANRLARAGAVPLAPGGIVLLQMEVPVAENAALIDRARAAGMRVVLNLAPAAALPGLPDILVVNEPEAAFLAGLHGCGADAASLHAALGCIVARTLGEAGAELAGPGLALHGPGFQVAVADTVGAGDAWCGALAAGLLAGLDWPAVLRRATRRRAGCGSGTAPQARGAGGGQPARSIASFSEGQGNRCGSSKTPGFGHDRSLVSRNFGFPARADSSTTE
jgi:ribokinase